MRGPIPLKFESIYGVDFSGAKLAGENIWIARLIPWRRSYELVELSRLRSLCGTADREPALAHLVRLIAESEDALWGLDFPFGLPVEVVVEGATWAQQLRWVSQWEHGAYALGEECVRRALRVGRSMHIRRATDQEARTPFDCYHYRIIFQTYHGMRDVLAPLSGVRGTAILPFHYHRLASARRVIVESCPGSTLKRLGLPHQNYKQAEGGSLTRRRLRTRHEILSAVSADIAISPGHRRTIMRNAGGDALDAVIAALGASQAWRDANHQFIPRHARYRREGRLYI